MDNPPVHIIDELVARPGQGERLLGDYLDGYAPGARARGMVLEQVLVSPPVWMDDQPNTLTIIWRVEGAGGWWAMRLAAAADPDVAAWWEKVADRLLDRKRSFAAAPDAIEGLCRG